MKNLLIIAAAVTIGLTACQSADTKATGNDQGKKDSTTILWLDSTYRDLGQVKEGTKVEVSYHFKNVGEHNLVLSNVTAQCGCTTPDWPKEPIAPGQESVIKAVFNSDGRIGENRKMVFVNANTRPKSGDTLTFRVEITE